MKKKIEKGSAEFNLFNEFWSFRKEYYAADNDEWWDEAIEEATKRVEKYRGTDLEGFAYSLYIAHLNDADKKFRESKGVRVRDKGIAYCSHCGKFAMRTS